MRTITQEEFRSLIYNNTAEGKEGFLGNKPTVVEFFATWCPHCRAMMPIVDVLNDRYRGTVDFFGVDIDQEPELTNAFDIEGTPTFLFYPLNRAPFRREGEMPAETLMALIESIR